MSSSQLSLEKDEFEVDVVEHRSTEQPLEDENLSSFLRSDEGQSVGRGIGEAAQQRSKVVVGTQSARFIVDEINLKKVYKITSSLLKKSDRKWENESSCLY